MIVPWPSSAGATLSRVIGRLARIGPILPAWNLSLNQIGAEGVRSLVESQSLANLTILKMDDQIGEEEKDLLRSRFGDQIRL